MGIWVLIVGILFTIISVWSWLVTILEDSKWHIHDVTRSTIFGTIAGPGIGIVLILMYFIGIE